MTPPNERTAPEAVPGRSKSVVATRLQDTGAPRIPHLAVDTCEHLVWEETPNRARYGPAEALDDCPDCHGSVQRFARHSEGLGELWETPLSVNTHDEPLSPRRPGAGILTLAMQTAAQGVTR